MERNGVEGIKNPPSIHAPAFQKSFQWNGLFSLSFSPFSRCLERLERSACETPETWLFFGCQRSTVERQWNGIEKGVGTGAPWVFRQPIPQRVFP